MIFSQVGLGEIDVAAFALRTTVALMAVFAALLGLPSGLVALAFSCFRPLMRFFVLFNATLAIGCSAAIMVCWFFLGLPLADWGWCFILVALFSCSCGIWSMGRVVQSQSPRSASRRG